MMYTPNPLNDDGLVDSIRSILLSKEDQRIETLERQSETRHYQYKVELELLQEYIRELLEELSGLQQVMGAGQEELRDLRMNVAILGHTGEDDEALANMTPMINQLIGRSIHHSREQMAETMAPIIGESLRVQIREGREDIVDAIGPLMAESIRFQIKEAREELAEAIAPIIGESIRIQIKDAREEIAEVIAPVMGESIRRQIHNEREDIVQALAPVMGESIRAQVRHERQDMIEALYPIIGQTVQRSIWEFVRELQRNIDGQLKATFGTKALLRTLMARLRGVPLAELALRNALPFTILELFLIQHKTGLLLAHKGEGGRGRDSDLVSSMLTVIRQFAQDSFGEKGEDKELEEIQYGDHRIIIQNGPAAYLAVVIEGIEPTGFRSTLHTFLSQLHVQHEAAFRQYDGDSLTLPHLQPRLAQFVAQSRVQTSASKESDQRPVNYLARAGLAMVLFIGFFCVLFTVMANLLPVSLASPLPTENPSMNVLAEKATATVIYTPVSVPIREASVAGLFTPTAEVLVVKPTSTLVPTYTPLNKSKAAIVENTPLPGAMTSGHIWVRLTPDMEAPRQLLLLRDTPVHVLRYSGEWAQVQWIWQEEAQEGWIPKQWVNDILSPTPYPYREADQ